MAENILGYLKKFPNKGYIINHQLPRVNANGRKTIELTSDFVNQYKYFKEEIDPRFPPALIDEMDMSIFSDANYRHNRRTRSPSLVLWDLLEEHQ